MKLLFIPYVWPEPRSSAAGLRIWGLVDAFRSAGHEVVLAAACRPNEAMAEVFARGVDATEIAMNDASFDEYLLNTKPDVVVFERFHGEERFGWRVEKILPDALRVVDTIDLHFLRRSRALDPAIRVGPSSEQTGEQGGVQAETEFLRELASIYRSDLTWMISDFETDLLTRHYGVPVELLQTVRFSYPPAPVLKSGFVDRVGFIFIGSFRHPPNVDAIRWLHEKIWPGIRARLPKAELRIYGSYPTREWMDRDQSRPGFRVLGAAGDAIEEIGRARVNLAPLRYGAGIKGKISDGWQAGTPCVTTPLGAEGMHGEFPFGGLVAADETALIDAAVKLYEDEALWQRGVEDGRRILAAHYDEQRNAEAVVARVTDQIAQRDALRAKNLTGRLLRYHGARSTEYFSRWVELKEKRGSEI